MENKYMGNKCKYCNPDNATCEYFKDPLDNSWFQDIETSEWDEYDDGYIHEKIYGVKYCQYCGRRLDG